MPNINLIAQKRQEKARLERNIRRLFFTMSGLFIAAIVLFTLLSAQWFRVKGDINSLEDEAARLEPAVQKIKDIESKTASLGPKIQLYTDARKHTVRWYTFLQVVARSLPQDTWLTRLATSQTATLPASEGPPPNVMVTLSGVTFSQQLVGETMLSLNRYGGLVEKVDLHYTQKGRVGDIPTVEFELAASISDLPAAFTGAPAAAGATKTASVGGTDANQAKS